MKKSLLVFIIFLLSLGGCTLFSKTSGKHEISSSLVDFLYPNKSAKKVKQKQEMPVLQLPVKVGLAFLPSKNWRGDRITEDEKLKLLNKVKASFGKHRFIDSITIIPSIYLRGGKGFESLDRLARLHDVDVMGLVSYDQVTQSLQNNASLLYWTIVGMYVVPGNNNSIQTFVDTAVFDIKSRKLLMRAPGISSIKKSSTAISVNSVLKEKSQAGFNMAFDDMIKNLDAELTQFRARAKEGKSVTIKHRQGYSSGGGGSFDMTFLLGLLILSALVIRKKRQS